MSLRPIFLAALLASFTTPLSAQVFSFSAEDLDQDEVMDNDGQRYSARAGFIDSFETSYNAGTGELLLDIAFSENNGSLANGYWFVVSDGPNPKGNVNEYAIFYFDASDPNNPIVSSYVYNGANSSSSWQNPGDLLYTSFDTQIQAIASTGPGSIDMSLTVDTTDLNLASTWPASYGLSEPDWDGALFGDTIGVWLHPFISENVQYNSDGSLKKLEIKKSGFYDFAKKEAIPEPSSALLLSLSGAALFLRRRR
ncbi:MAG: PEP-CTERM sorting domain-containing protein [Verrucomicrobiota bacterium]